MFNLSINHNLAYSLVSLCNGGWCSSDFYLDVFNILEEHDLSEGVDVEEESSIEIGPHCV
jgi:hypothetical protein